jgi:hypothetical protein
MKYIFLILLIGCSTQRPDREVSQYLEYLKCGSGHLPKDVNQWTEEDDRLAICRIKAYTK